MTNDSPYNLPVRRHHVVPASQVPEREGITAFFSGTTRKGRWALPQRMRVACIMGDITLDLREAEIAEGVSEIEVLAVLGNCKVIVPPGVRVESAGDGFFGSFELKMSGAPDFPPDAPTLRIRGTAYLSSVETMAKPIGKKELRAERKFLEGA